MPGKIVLYNLPPSPNCIKARLALNYKKLPFEKIDINPGDRSAVLAASGQPLTPVMRHGDTIVFDSYAIVRYLDANFPDTPRLFSKEYETMHAIEDQEVYARTRAAEPVRKVFRQFRSGAADAAVGKQASALLHEVTAAYEKRLQEGPWLMGEHLTAADLTAAPLVFYGMLPEKAEAGNPVAAFFRQHLQLGEERDRTRDWVRRVMAYDR